MSYVPISRFPFQYFKLDGTPANGYYLKFYQANSATPINMQTDSGGATSIAKCKLNDYGFPISNPNDNNTVFIPHLLSTYTAFRFVLYASSADADANNVTSGLPNVQSVGSVDIDDLRDDLAASSGSSLVGFIQAGAGAIPRTAQAKMREFVSVLDFDAKGDGSTDDTAAIQAAIDAVFNAGGGGVFVPPVSTYYEISSALLLKNNVTLFGVGPASRIHSVNTTRLGGIKATGVIGARLSRISCYGINVTSTTTFTAGAPSNQTGAGIDAIFADDFSVTNCFASGWSDNGIGSTDGQRCKLNFNTVDVTAQGVQAFAKDADVYGAQLIGNVVTNTGQYNGIHTEGNASGGTGKVISPRVIGNDSNGAYNLGVNVENSPYAVVSGNTARNSGLIGGGSPTLLHGVHLFGSPNSSVTGNVAFSNLGYGIVISANCGETVVDGNSTTVNNAGSCLVTDLSGTAATYNVAMGVNSFPEGEIVESGNVSLKYRSSKTATFTPVAKGASTAGAGTYTVQFGSFTIKDRTCEFNIEIGWSAHTGTGNLTIDISGMALTPVGAFTKPVNIWVNGLQAAGQTVQASIPQTYAGVLNVQGYDPTTGAATAIAIDGTVAGLLISGRFNF